MKKNKIYEAAAAVISLIVLCVSGYVRIRLINAPLNRDEAVWAYSGLQYMKGIVPYSNIFDTKLPGVSYIYGIFMAVFGNFAASIRLSAAVASLLTGCSIYALCRKFFDTASALFAAGIYFLFSTSFVVLGVYAYTEHYASLFAVSAIYFSVLSLEKKSPWLILISGVLASFSVLCRQTALLMIIPAAIVAVHSGSAGEKIRKAVVFLAGFVLSFAVLFSFIGAAGVFGRSMFILLKYSAIYAGIVKLSDAPAYLGAFFAHFHPGMWVLAFLILASLTAAVFRSARDKRALFVVILFLLSAAACSAGFQFREHYFILMVPACSIAAAYLMDVLPEIRAGRALCMVFFVAAAVMTGVSESSLLFKSTPEEVNSSVFTGCPFNEAVAIGHYIREKTAPGDTIAVLGSEPEIYFYSERKAALEYLSFYDMMWGGAVSSAMQEDAIRQIKTSRPTYLVFSNIPVSWRIMGGSDMRIFEWYKKYRPGNLVLEGTVDMISPGMTRYVFGKELDNYIPGSHRLDIYRVKY
jgi:hypothetical protein